jgi:hypothetical protein
MKFSDKFYPDAIECEVDNGEKAIMTLLLAKKHKTIY